MKNVMFSLFLGSITFLLVLHFYPEKELSQQDIDRIYNKKAELIIKTRRLYNIDFDLPLYIESINNRIWGAMLYSQGTPQKIVINKEYYLENPDYVINYVMPHEWAHVVSRLIYKTSIRSHGEEFLKICDDLSEFRCDVVVRDEFVAEEKVRSSLRKFLGE